MTTERVNLPSRVPPVLREKLRAYAADHGISMNAAVCVLLTSALQDIRTDHDVPAVTAISRDDVSTTPASGMTY